MERSRSEGNSARRARNAGGSSLQGGALGWWYRYFAPGEPIEVASLAQRERVRHGRTASIVMLIFILFLLVMLIPAVMAQDDRQIMVIGVGIGGTLLALLLNRKGLIRVAGLLVLVIVYAGEICSLVMAGGLTASNTFLLDFTVIPDVVVLAFFSANSLFSVVWLNVLLTWLLIVFGPHDASVTDILRHEPLSIFAHVYILQLLIASILYLWARSTELALKRADRAEEIISLEKRENERKQLELEQKNQLDAGIQQILQTHVAVANGDLSARAPLSQDHMLWQVAISLNNLIARLQSLSHTESELRQQIWEGNERVTDHHNATYTESGKTTGAQRVLPPGAERTTGAQRVLPPEAERTTGAQRVLGFDPGAIRAQRVPRPKVEMDQQSRSKQDRPSSPEPGGTGGRLRALRLEQEGGADQEKVAHPEPGGIAGAQDAAYPEQRDAKDHINRPRE